MGKKKLEKEACLKVIKENDIKRSDVLGSRRRRERRQLNCKKNTMLCWINKRNRGLKSGPLGRSVYRKLWEEWGTFIRKQTMPKGSRTSAPSNNNSKKTDRRSWL